MTAILRTVKCSKCGKRTRHLAVSLERMVRLQSQKDADGCPLINFACPRCDEITLSHVLPGAFGHLRAEFNRFTNVSTEYVVSLQCAIEGCASEVILLAPVQNHMITIESLCQHFGTNWHSSNAVCGRGHSPAVPLAVLDVRYLNSRR